VALSAVQKQSDRYYVYNRGDFFRDQMQKRAPGTPAASTAYRLDNTPTYFCDVWAEAKPIPDQLRGNADAVLNMDRDATEFLSQQALIRREKIFAANLFTTGKWGTDVTGVAAGPAAGQFLQWNDPASNPIEDIRAGKLAIKQAILDNRQRVLTAAFQQHPERFVRKPPRPAPLPDAVWINPPKPAPPEGGETH
jgi:hypothetical protein